MVRVRFAPSPTGELHIGGARTALYNYLFAKQQGGQFIIRIEDTDQERFVAGSLERILQGLKWLGLTWEEGPDVGGSNGPYVQSERLSIYQEQARELVKKGSAYYCFCSTERLGELRKSQEAQKLPTRYDRACFNLDAEEVAARLARGEKATIRLKIPGGTTQFTDLVHGLIKVANNTLDDQVLLKSDGFPTYHLACVVDDHLMGISHIIRGEEWLPSAPKHVILYQALGWEPPQFAHLPNVLNEQRAKLSKRKDGEAVWLQTYQNQGYLPQAMVNFLVLLGWHPQDDREIFSLAELSQIFELERVQKGGAIFNFRKLNWFNAEYIKKLPLVELNQLLQPYYQKINGAEAANKDTTKLTEVLRSRLVTLADSIEQAGWYFAQELALTPDLLTTKGSTAAKAKAAQLAATASLAEVGEWQITELKQAMAKINSAGEFTRGELLWPVRVALTGQRQSPDVFEVAWALGKNETLKRLNYASKVLAAE
ncbi:MAG: glutamate--tRNA ligase [Candidatus Kerfeldbacteria bacterium]|nr:glutamate--tRNA ligase [Candidatus Kerfeldbacteria bacterium]